MSNEKGKQTSQLNGVNQVKSEGEKVDHNFIYFIYVQSKSKKNKNDIQIVHFQTLA